MNIFLECPLGWVLFESARGMATVFQFRLYDITTDSKRISRRWGTREAIAALGGEILEETATEIAEADLRSDLPGLSAIGFRLQSYDGIQRQVY